MSRAGGLRDRVWPVVIAVGAGIVLRDQMLIRPQKWWAVRCYEKLKDKIGSAGLHTRTERLDY